MKIAYYYINWTSFVEKDVRILNESFKVQHYCFGISNKFSILGSLSKQLLRHLNPFFKPKVVVVQFAGLHAFIPVFMSRFRNYKVVLVLGGTDCVSFPSLNYGQLYKKSTRGVTAWVLKHADLLLPVHDSLVYTECKYYYEDFECQGYQFHVPESKRTPYEVIYNGYEPDKWKLSKNQKKNSLITICGDADGYRYELKGVDLFVELAAHMPECSFTIVGVVPEHIVLTSNVEVLGMIPNHKLADILGTKQFYLQLSISEGFPNALCEAMLCGSIPIVSDVAAMPYIVQKDQFILHQRNLDKLILKFRELQEMDIKPESIRSLITPRFDLEKRAKQLNNAIQNLAQSKNKKE